MLARRIQKEFNLLGRSYERRQMSRGIERIIFTHQGHDIIADLPPEYPFKPPNALFVNGAEMSHDYFYNRPKFIMNEMHFSKCCFMCQSFLCGDNWSPSLTLNNVVTQILNY